MANENNSYPIPTPVEMLTFSDDAFNGNIPQLKKFLEKFDTANINYQDSVGWTALMNAACNQEPDTIIFLLQHGADAEMTTKKGLTAQMIAEINGCHRNAQYLEQYTRDLVHKRAIENQNISMQKKIDGRIHTLKSKRPVSPFMRRK